MYRACELKDQTYKKTRTLQFSEFVLHVLMGRCETVLRLMGHEVQGR